MKSIKEAAASTGISEQNIRYYEKQGLIHPARNKGNSYREYSDEDIRRLKLIRLFRKLDMPIAHIHSLFQGTLSLEEALEQHREYLEEEKNRLTAAIDFCSKIQERQLAEVDADHYLAAMEEAEQKGSVFARFAEDYKAVSQAESRRTFSFMPDAPCGNPEEFAQELQKFAAQEGMELSITRRGMTPHFELDGIEYNAYRTSSRFGIVIHCEMLHPEDYLPQGMSAEKYRRFRFLSLIWLPLLIFIGISLLRYRDLFSSVEGMAVFGVMVVLFVASFAFFHYSYGRNFKG